MKEKVRMWQFFRLHKPRGARGAAVALGATRTGELARGARGAGLAGGVAELPGLTLRASRVEVFLFYDGGFQGVERSECQQV